jgi:hypothetical protein
VDTGWAGADLVDQAGAVLAQEPLHVGERGAGCGPGPVAEQGGQRLAVDRVKPGPRRIVVLARQQHCVLDPRRLQDLERRREVARARAPHRLAPDGHGLAGVLARLHELLDLERLDRCRLERRHIVLAVDAASGAGTEAGLRLDDHREADLVDERAQLGRGPRQRAARHRHAARAQHLLHAVLVAEVARDGAGQAVDAERVAHLRHRQLQLLEHAGQAIDRADRARDRAHRDGELAAVEAVGDAIVAGDARAQGGGNRLLRVGADHAERDAVELGERPHVAVRVLEEARGDEDHVRHERSSLQDA